jgi:3-hydroxymyristoyl/3-hydroxydecanoyl-(acyl carrier protein) dehydratase
MDDARLDETLRRLREQAGDYLTAQALHSSRAQANFLTARSAALRQMGDLLRLQAQLSGSEAVGSPTQPVLLDRSQLEEFAAGSVERCLGPEYAVFRGRRVPRIPNGALLLMDRVLEIRGERGKLNQPAEITTEYDVPADAWFYQDTGCSATPYSILMEMALQPCGLLSAYLGTMLITPGINLYFRNLDGEAHLLRSSDLRGKTLRAWARLLSHTLNEETVIQKFAFRLECDGQVFYEGQSVFGFFPEETMLRQIGLDGGKESLPVYLQPNRSSLNGKLLDLKALADRAGLRMANGRFDLLDEVYLDPQGGSFTGGYIFALRQIHPEDWYFRNHFHQDPVMPGSLGVEAILEAMRAFAIDQGLGREFNTPRFDLVESLPFAWKYRGQILQNAGQMRLEVHLHPAVQEGEALILSGDASLWAGKVRIYHVKNAAIRIVKG